MGEDICKQCNQQGLNFQNTQTVHIIQYQKNEQPNQKMGRRSKQIFLQRRHTDDQQAHEKMLIIANFQKMQIKTTVRYHLKPVRMAIIKKSTYSKFWRGCGEKGNLLHCWWECKLVQPLWKTAWRFLKKLKNSEIMTFAATWMDLEIIILSEVSQTEKEKYHMISLICVI